MPEFGQRGLVAISEELEQKIKLLVVPTQGFTGELEKVVFAEKYFGPSPSFFGATAEPILHANPRHARAFIAVTLVKGDPDVL